LYWHNGPGCSKAPRSRRSRWRPGLQGDRCTNRGHRTDRIVVRVLDLHVAMHAAAPEHLRATRVAVRASRRLSPLAADWACAEAPYPVRRRPLGSALMSLRAVHHETDALALVLELRKVSPTAVFALTFVRWRDQACLRL